MLWTREHGLTGNVLSRFESIINFVVNVYFRLYFDIKVKNSLVHGPHHIVTALRLLRSQPEEVRHIVTRYVCSGAHHAHSESVILTLLASESENDRALGVELVLKIRGDDEYGDVSVRKHKTPSLNLEATSPANLICWEDEECYEPIFTCQMSRDEIEELRSKPLEAPDFPIHTQSTERAVQLVSQAAQAVFGPDRRDGYVRARIAHREIMPVFRSKRDILVVKSL